METYTTQCQSRLDYHSKKIANNFAAHFFAVHSASDVSLAFPGQSACGDLSGDAESVDGGLY